MMTAIGKLLIIIWINTGALALLIYKLIKDGHTYPEAVRNAWDLIIFQREPNFSSNTKIPWTALLAKTWWLMILIFIITWVNSSELSFWPVLLFLLILHLYWFLEGHVIKGEKFERILNLNQSWGIIYKEIGAGSGANLKTLAELDLRKKNLLVLAIERQGRLTPFPKGLEILNNGDRIIMFGEIYSFRSIFEDNNESKPVIPG